VEIIERLTAEMAGDSVAEKAGERADAANIERAEISW
jgi:hypothetical protein